MRTLPILIFLAACQPSNDPGPSPSTGSTTSSTTIPLDEWPCTLEGQDTPSWADQVGCMDDFDKIASVPLDASIPGARSSKTVVDRLDTDRLYFMNSQLYPIHWEFASEHLSGNGLPIVPDLGSFNITEYFSPDRRFILGAVTYYEEPNVWAYELAPYDTASAEMIELAYTQIRDSAWFGPALKFHPSSEAQETESENLSSEVAIITTDELFDGITYQPLNLGTSMGQLTFHTAEEVDGNPIPFSEIVVLDAIPNDIGIVQGIITDAFQTPLSHINVLSQNRGTPNMSLIGAWEDEQLRSLEGKWVELTVGPFEPILREVTFEEYELWWEENKPEPLETTDMDLTLVGLWDAENILPLDTFTLADAITTRIPAFGGKATHFGGLSLIGAECPVPDGFGVPMFYYDQFMLDNGFWDRVHGWIDDPEDPTDPFDDLFYSDPQYRQDLLHQLQDDMLAAPIDTDFLIEMYAKLDTEFPGVRMRFRSSTNAEDLGAFTGAGLYTSKAGTPGDPDESIEEAIRTVWSSVWNPRAFDEREYYSIDHLKVGMGLLVHPSFPDEEANGVAITNNIFDTSGLEPAFYVNVQQDGWSVVLPEIGVTSDQVLHYYDQAGQPVVYIGHSNIIPPDWTVLSNQQINELGNALAAIRTYFQPVYGDRTFYAMDTEFKFDDQWSADGTPELWLKQARPYPGWGESPE